MEVFSNAISIYHFSSLKMNCGFRPRGFPPNQQFRPPPPQNPHFQPQPPNQQFRHEQQHYPNSGWVETPPRQQRPLVEPPGNAMPPQSINQDEINKRIEANKKRGKTKVKVNAPRDPAQITPKSKTVRALWDKLTHSA